MTVPGSAVTLRHPLVRSAVYQAATAKDRRAAHLALAGALAASEDRERATWHRAKAADGPDATWSRRWTTWPGERRAAEASARPRTPTAVRRSCPRTLPRARGRRSPLPATPGRRGRRRARAHSWSLPAAASRTLSCWRTWTGCGRASRSTWGRPTTPTASSCVPSSGRSARPGTCPGDGVEQRPFALTTVATGRQPCRRHHGHHADATGRRAHAVSQAAAALHAQRRRPERSSWRCRCCTTPSTALDDAVTLQTSISWATSATRPCTWRGRDLRALLRSCCPPPGSAAM